MLAPAPGHRPRHGRSEVSDRVTIDVHALEARLELVVQLRLQILEFSFGERRHDDVGNCLYVSIGGVGVEIGLTDVVADTVDERSTAAPSAHVSTLDEERTDSIRELGLQGQQFVVWNDSRQRVRDGTDAGPDVVVG